MTLPELEHAATAPYRFMDLVKLCSSPHGIYVIPFQTREHLQRMPRKWVGQVDAEVVETYNFCLVPGGRFLIASWESELILWDLGYSLKQYVDPFPVALGELHGNLITTKPTTNGEELIIATVAR